MILVRWTYTADEWKAFRLWAERKRGWLPYLLHRVFTRNKLMTPVIMITPDHVHYGNRNHFFQDTNRSLKDIDVRAENGIHVVSICYERKRESGVEFKEITILVPKGKLREALDVQNRLNSR